MSEMSREGSYVLDSESAVEMTRLIEQYSRVIQTMGGPFSGLPELPRDAKVLDLACGPGGWVLDVAFERPDIEVAGIDISRIMVDYANARARTMHLSNASFGVMDITKPLDFGDGSFDLVNAAGLVAVLRRENWEPFIAECTRLLRPGGFIRLAEPHDFGVSNSAAFERIQNLGTQMLWRVGYGFSVDGRTFGLAHTLPSLLRRAGYSNVQHSTFAIEISSGQPAWIDYYHNYQLAFQQAKTIWINAGLVTEEEFDQLYQNMLIDMNRQDFLGMVTFICITGEKPKVE
ncbi:MAG TPA: methyltransferase domain-containing protein [Ktedonobacteraceae bacterium]|nr:methyltransferase domain-containing protein [Ktedonobacteraceae bacterium]